MSRRIPQSGGSLYFVAVSAFMFALVLALTGLFCKNAAQQIYQNSALRQSGLEVQGEVTQIEAVPRSMDVVSYTFVVDGKMFSGRAGIPARFERNLSVSDVLLVRYLPTDPKINHPSAWEPGWSVSSSLFGLGVSILFMTLFSIAPIKAFKDRRSAS